LITIKNKGDKLKKKIKIKWKKGSDRIFLFPEKMSLVAGSRKHYKSVVPEPRQEEISCY